jgi:hypothetical protein
MKSSAWNSANWPKESDQHKLGRILKKFSGCRKSDRRSLNRAQAIASQDKRKLLSEARAVPPLMSGTIINSSTVAWHTTVTSHKKSVSLKNNERMMELFEFGSTRF